MSDKEFRRWRCGNGKCSQGEFIATAPVCPGCKVDSRIPRYAGIVIELQTIHFDPPDPILSDKGLNVLACDPEKPATYPYVSTAVHSVVNCEECKATEAYKSSYRPPRLGVLGKPGELVEYGERVTVP